MVQVGMAAEAPGFTCNVNETPLGHHIATARMDAERAGSQS